MTNIGGFVTTQHLAEIIKDTLDKVDYSINWGPRLADFAGSLSTSVWTFPADLVQVSPVPTINGDITTIHLSLGSIVAGARHTVRNTITADGRTLTKSFIIVMALR